MFAVVKSQQMSHFFCRALMAGLLLLFLPVAHAASTNSAWSVHVWQSSDGLPNNNVTAISQTDDGFLWIANPSHLARFDGVNFKGIPLRMLIPEIDQETTTLLHSRSGALWIGMNRGMVLCLKEDALDVYTNDLPSEYIQALAEDNEGSIWITFRGGNVRCIRNGKVTRFGVSAGLPSGYECFFAQDVKTNLWFAKGTNAGMFSGNRFKTIVQLPRSITGIIASSKGGVWLASGGHLYHCDSNGTLKDCGEFCASTLTAPTPMLEDTVQALWIGTSDQGLFRYDGVSFENVPVSNDEILSIFQDREQNLWVGTDGGGMNRIDLRAMELQGTDDGLSSPVVRSLCQDAHGMIWAATKDGAVVCQSNGTWHVVMPAHTSDGTASCVAAGADGAVWVGTESRMLHCWRDGQMTTLRAKDGLSSKVVRGVLVDHTGAVWMIEEYPNAIQCYRDGKFYSYSVPAETRAMRPIIEDHDGSIWIGSSRGTLLKIKDGKLIDETAQTTSIRPFAIRSLYVSPDNSLWIGYAGAGVGHLKDGKFKRISTGEGLSDGYISLMSADDHGWVWFGTDSGIFKVRLQNLEDVVDGKASRVDCIHYKDFPALQAYFGYSPAMLKSSDGRLWMPMLTALAVIDPNRISEDAIPANPLLEQISVDDNVAATYGGMSLSSNVLDLEKPGVVLDLPPGRHRLEFDFTALSFSAPENIQFRYRLEGLDTHWIQAGTQQRTAIYPQVSTGKYTFEVMACNSDGVWSTISAAITLHVAPFYWQTWWFRIAVVLGFIGIIRYISVRHFRVKLQMLEHQAALDKERMRIAKDLHDDLGTQLTKIVLLSGLAQRDQTVPGKSTEHLKKLSAAAQQVINSLDETVWAVNPRNNTLAHLINYVGRFAIEFLKTAEIHCVVDLPEHPPNRDIPAAVRHNLFLAVKEALNNVVRHANAGTVKLRITVTGQLLEISIEDDGCGFSEVPANNGSDGLYNMRQRIEEIGGTFQLKSEPRSGTRIVFTSPCNGKNGH
jgi:signal transduction histidine kinase/ligand-binding sensor domain-containing protein